MENSEPISKTTDNLITKTFFRMFLGLIATAITAFYTYSSGLYLSFVTDSTYGILLIAEVVVVLLFSFLFRKLSATMVSILFFAYACLNGVTLSTIFAVFDITSIGYAFLATSLLFGVLAFMGYKTNRDMSKTGNILYATLFVGVIVSIINLFLHNTIVDIILDWVILFVFFGLTVYDMNKIKRLDEDGILEPDKIYVYGAMELYLDFINIFLRILSIFGRNKN